jgi:transaldolase
MKSLQQLKVKLFADGADRSTMLEMYGRSYIRGLTTNPTLMRAAGVANYLAFARDMALSIRDKPLCFGVLADDFALMERQALALAELGDNIYVKIPITNTAGESCSPTVKRLTDRQVKVNVTALLTLAQVRHAAAVLSPATRSFVSIFAGRIADTGVDPAPLIAQAVEILRPNPGAEIIWASPRELLNVFQADSIGCHAITLTSDILNKLHLIGYDLSQYSLDTVAMFDRDARAAGYTI